MEAATTTAQALRQRVIESFSVDAMVDSILAGYQQAIDGAPATHRKVLLQA